jgi:putative ABC transport system permease protein
MADMFPQIETATRAVSTTQRFGYQENVYSLPTQMVDENFFDVFGLDFTAGDPDGLRTVNDVLLSESTAAKIFADENPIGQPLTFGRVSLTVRAVYRDLPKNSHWQADAFVHLDITEIWGWYQEWDGGGNYRSYFKLRPGTRIEQIEADMPAFLERYVPDDLEDGVLYSLVPVKDVHLRNHVNGSVRSTVTLYTVLALMALFAAALNYVLISVSSLAGRSRTIAVQKVNGAQSGDIFGGFLVETALLLLFCVGLAVLLILAFRQQIEMFTAESLSTLFAPDRLAALAGVVALFFAVAGLIPGYLFARIPVRQAFAMSGVNKRGWKKALLFTLFFGVSFAFVFLSIIVLQYRYFLNKDLGYDHERVVTISLQNVLKERYNTLAADLAGMPFVEGMALSNNLFLDGLSGGSGIRRPDGEFFWPRMIEFDYRMLPLYGIAPVQGDNFREDSPANAVLINENVVRQMGWTDVPVGQPIEISGQSITVVGVIPDLQLGSLVTGNQPLVATPRTMRDSTASSARVSIRLNEITPENLERLNEYFAERFPEQQQTVALYDRTLENQYVEERYFRNAVLAGAVITFLIALMGLVGYVNDEVRLRRREIAIRKVHGATLGDVLAVISKGILTLALAAAVLGCALAYVLGSDWLSNFANRIPLSAWIFIGGTLAVLAIIAATIVARAWRAANENPVVAIKAE